MAVRKLKLSVCFSYAPRREDVWESGDVAPYIHNLGAGRLSGPQIWPGPCRKEECLVPAGIECFPSVP